MEGISDIIFLTSIASALIMTGALWLSQLSTYPLMAFVAKEDFHRYEREHVKRISFIAWFVLTLDLFFSFLLFFTPYFEKLTSFTIFNFASIALVWISTWTLQFPYHKTLEKGFDAHAHKMLVKTNWLRTIIYALRTVGILVVLFQLI